MPALTLLLTVHKQATGLTLQGYLKVGTKRLYLADTSSSNNSSNNSSKHSSLAPSDALCLLDFYTHHRSVVFRG
jgi:GNAT acetyltransferase, Mec-17